MTDMSAALAQLDAAAAEGKLSPGTVENIRAWLTHPRYAEYAPAVAEHLAAGKWKILDDVFWTVIPFGTGGRRGMMYPIGTNAINERTMGESAQGLADYVREQHPGKPLACAIAYDTRRRSRQFAELCAEIMAAAGFKVYFLDGYRSTPELSFAVRLKQCDCGIMITASHNPPCDNAVKAYWSTGGQLLPPHDQGVIDRVMGVGEIQRLGFAEGLASGWIEYCQAEVDPAYIARVKEQSFPGPRRLKIIYSPLHGVGQSAVCPALAAAGFSDVEVFAPHAAPDPDFPNVPNHVANPENAVVFDAIIERGKQIGADLILATDPDCDRLGCAAPLTLAQGAPWATLTGNQIGALLTDYLLAHFKAAGRLTPRHYVVKTLVTTELVRRVADDYGIETVGDLLVGFKYIGGTIDERGPEGFVLGAEESYGFLAGTHARDKDAAVAAMLLSELAAEAKQQGQSIHERFRGLLRRYGVYVERAFSATMPGAQGMERMVTLMTGLRANPPQRLGSVQVVSVRDYLIGTHRRAGKAAGDAPWTVTKLPCPKGDLIMFDLETAGNYVAVRPSGTEPKVKFYLFAYEPPQPTADLTDIKDQLAKRLESLEADLRSLAGV